MPIDKPPQTVLAYLPMKLNREKIRQTLSDKGWSMAELARQSNVSRQWIFSILNDDEKDVRLSTVNALAAALEIDSMELIE